jgi:biotin carboxyl carrier protein
MRYVANLEGVDRELEIEETGANSLRLQFDGKAFDLDVQRIGASSVSILIGERSFDFDVGRQNDDLIVASRGIATRVTLSDSSRRTRVAADRAHAGGKVELKAMMPGRVINLLVNVGDEVAAQQGIVIVEAMKMENELKSPKAGKVIEIKVVAGQTVEKGALLVVIE